MIIIGFIQTDIPRALINPVMCRSEREVYTWLASFFNDENFVLDGAITQDSIGNALESNVPVLIQINGYKVAIMFGLDEVIQANTDRFVHTDSFRYTDFMAN